MSGRLPPATARIEYLYSFSLPSDLGLKESFSRKLRDLFTGSDDRSMSRPYAIAVYEEQVAVADPGLGVIHLFDTGRKRYRRINEAGGLQLVSPVGIALAKNRIYIADSVLGAVFVLDGHDKLLMTLGELERPTGLAFHQQRQQLYVVDTAAHQVKIFDRSGEKISVIGGRGSGNGQFNYPSHLALANGSLFVNDTMNFRIQTFALDGKYISTFGKHGDGSGSFTQPKGIAVDPDGHIYVADAMANQVQIFDPQGLFLLGFGGPGSDEGAFHMPAGLTMSNDLVYVADSFNQRVQVFRYLREN